MLCRQVYIPFPSHHLAYMTTYAKAEHHNSMVIGIAKLFQVSL